MTDLTNLQKKWADAEVRQDRIYKAVDTAIALMLAIVFVVVLCWLFPHALHFFV